MRGFLLIPVLLLFSAGAAPASEPWGPGEEGVIVSEVHYHPLDDASEGEFVELWNTSHHGVDVSGWRFSEGIAFTFPASCVIEPGGRLVVARSAEVVSSRSGAARVIGDFEGSLSDGGELLVLRSRTGRVVLRFSYGDGAGARGDLWPRRPDGEGPSLELVSAGLEWGQPWHWRPSRRLGGTPGRGRSPGGATGRPPVRLNEAGTAGGKPFVEIHNGGRARQSLVGWRLRPGGRRSSPSPCGGRSRAVECCGWEARESSDCSPPRRAPSRSWTRAETSSTLSGCRGSARAVWSVELPAPGGPRPLRIEFLDRSGHLVRSGSLRVEPGRTAVPVWGALRGRTERGRFRFDGLSTEAVAARPGS